MAIVHALDPPHENFHIRQETIPDCELHLDVLSTGLLSTEGDDINCEKAEDVGRNIQAALDNAFFNDAST